MTLQLFSVSIFSLELVTHEEINFFPKPIITLPEEINGISWSENNYFALAEQKYVCFSIDETLGEQLIASPGGDVKFIKFVKNPETQDDQLLVLTENNVIGMKTFSENSGNYLMTKVYDPENKINAVDFSPNGDRILIGFENGEVRLMAPEYLNQTSSEYKLTDHVVPEDEKKESGVYSVAFSPDSRYFLSAGKDGFINIYDRVKEAKKIYTIKVDVKTLHTVSFSSDSRFVVSVKDNRDILFRDFAGNVIQTIKIERYVKEYSMSTDSKYLFVLADNSLIYIYDVDTGKKEGFIPSFNKSPITKFAFNKDESRLIIAHEDGSVYYLKSEDVIMSPDSKPPKLGRGTLGVGSTGFKRDDNSIEIRADCAFLNYIYNITPQLSLGFINASIINPLYFGFLARAGFSFPAKDYPYEYWSGDSKISPPNLVSASFLVPFGITFFPFNAGMELFAEVAAGVAVYSLFQSNKTFYGKHFTPAVSIIVGIGFKRVCVSGGVNYDMITNFTLKAGVSYRIRIGKA